MRQLMLLRHAKSSWDDPATADKDRTLNADGRRAAALIRDTIRKLGLTPDLILVSSARRTLETLDLLEPWDEMPLIETMDSLYLASADRLLAAVRGVAETVRGVLVIAHNPGMHDLALALADAGDDTGGGSERITGGTIGGESPSAMHPADSMRRLANGFPTAGLAEFAIPGPWSSLDAGGGRLVRFLTPRFLSRNSQGTGS